MAKLCQRNGQVAGYSGFAIGWLRAGDQKRTRRPIWSREQNRGAETAKRFAKSSMLCTVPVNEVPGARVFARAISCENERLVSREESMDGKVVGIGRGQDWNEG